MSGMRKQRKQIAFDLDTEALKKYYPANSWNNAYYDIKKFMVGNGFIWIQGSVYVSERTMTSTEVTYILNNLIKKHDWLNVCMRDCRETDIGKQHVKNHLFDKNDDIKTREEIQRSKWMTMAEVKGLIKAEREKEAYKDSSFSKTKKPKSHER